MPIAAILERYDEGPAGEQLPEHCDESLESIRRGDSDGEVRNWFHQCNALKSAETRKFICPVGDTLSILNNKEAIGVQMNLCVYLGLHANQNER